VIERPVAVIGLDGQEGLDLILPGRQQGEVTLVLKLPAETSSVFSST